MIDTASNAEMMELFGVSDRTVTQHGASGIFVKVGRGRYDVKASVRAYTEHLRKAASGRASPNDELRSEKVRLTKLQADRAQADLDAASGLLVSVTEFEARWDHEMVTLRQGLLGLANRIAEDQPQLTRHEVSSIDATIRSMMQRVADDANARLRSIEAADDQARRTSRKTHRR